MIKQKYPRTQSGLACGHGSTSLLMSIVLVILASVITQIYVDARPNVSPGYSGQKADGTPDIDFGPYMANLQRRIKRAWFPPRGQESKRAQVTFKIDRSGALSHLKMLNSTGDVNADQAALKAVENAAPFKPLPDGSPEQVDIQFTFDYNVFGHGSSGSGRTDQAQNIGERSERLCGNKSSCNWLAYLAGAAILGLFTYSVAQRSRQDTVINLKSATSNHKPRL